MWKLDAKIELLKSRLDSLGLDEQEAASIRHALVDCCSYRLHFGGRVVGQPQTELLETDLTWKGLLSEKGQRFVNFVEASKLIKMRVVLVCIASIYLLVVRKYL